WKRSRLGSIRRGFMWPVVLKGSPTYPIISSTFFITWPSQSTYLFGMHSSSGAHKKIISHHEEHEGHEGFGREYFKLADFVLFVTFVVSSLFLFRLRLCREFGFRSYKIDGRCRPGSRFCAPASNPRARGSRCFPPCNCRK